MMNKCLECGALNDPDQICICKSEEVPDTDQNEVYDDWQTMKFEIEPFGAEVFTLMYNGEKEPPKQWDVFSGENNCGDLLDCTLRDALKWICDLGFLPHDTIDYLLKDMEEAIQNEE